MIFPVFLLFVSAVFCQYEDPWIIFGENNKYEGNRCYKDGVLGVCRYISECKPALDDVRMRKHPQICSFDKKDPIVCCVEENPEKPENPTRPPDEENFEALCEPLRKDYTPAKTGQKAFDKCIEYQKKYVYPCERGVDLLGSFSRQHRCHHNTDDLIIGGTDANMYEFPHMVMLGYGPLESIDWSCGGAIISERFVLTAGHCTYRSHNDPVSYLLIGALRRSDANPSNIYKVKNIIQHPKYKSPIRYNDIALIETAKVMKLDQYTVPACLHIGDFVNDSRVIAAGWGFTHAKEQQSSDNLKKVTLTKFSGEECSKKYPPYRLMKRGIDDKTQSCYGDPDLPTIYQGLEEYKDTCKGDSGGPIQLKNQKIHCMYTIVGVTSVGKTCGNGQKPAIYTRLAPYLPWIEDIVWPN